MNLFARIFWVAALPALSLQATERPDREYPADEPWTVSADRVVQGDPAKFPKTAVAADGAHLTSSYLNTDHTWQLGALPTGLARLSAPQTPLLEALWNLSLDEAVQDVIASGSQKGGFSAGAQWPGVWTRDVSYSAHLSLAWLFPAQVEASLRAKVDALGRIVQDTGTGGSWPVSTDRVVWALAARELYRATGNRDWLAWAYTVVQKTAEIDRQTAFDPASGLYFGETSFMDWREQTYPAWMQPIDIYQSPALGTNVAHKLELDTLAWFSAELGRPEAETALWKSHAAALSAAIDKTFYRPDTGWYAIYRYPVLAGAGLSDRSDTLGNALAVLAGVAPPDRAQRVMAALPVVPFGPPVIYPQLGGVGPYHNRAIWPFVTAYYGWAAAASQNPGAALWALEANLRAGALFLTNKENYVYDTGHTTGTAVNSDRQLWSVAGQLGGILRTVFGFTADDAGVSFHPLVPAWVKGELTLTGLAWRGAVLNLKVRGTGTRLKTLTINGSSVPIATVLPPTTRGAVNVVLELAGDAAPPKPAPAPTAAKGPWDAYSPQLIAAADGARTLKWKTRSGVAVSQVYQNGVLVGQTPGNSFSLPAPVPAAALEIVTVRTVADTGVPATLMEPLLLSPGRVLTEFPDVELDAQVHTSTEKTLTLPYAATWFVRWRYSNTNGPVSTDNKCALRTLWVDGNRVGVVVLPQRGSKAGDKGLTNGFALPLTAGAHTLKLTLEPGNENMNIAVNGAWVDAVEAIPLTSEAP